MPITFRTGESLGAAKARQSGSNTISNIRRAMTSDAAYKVDVPKKKKAPTVKVSAAPAAKIEKAPVISAAPAAKIEKAPVSFGVLKTDTAPVKTTTFNAGSVVNRAINPVQDISTPALNITSISSKAPNIPQYIAAPSAANAPDTKVPALENVQKLIDSTKPKQTPVQATPPERELPEKFDLKTYNRMAKEKLAGEGPLSKISPLLGGIGQMIAEAKYGDGGVKYNQAYWAARLAGGATQEELAKEQAAVKAEFGGGGAYSGKDIVTDPTKLAEMTTKAESAAAGLNTVAEVQTAIEATTDEAELAALHKRLRALSRGDRTQTKFGGLDIGLADVAATKLGGLRIK